ncbi:hypothetical protein [uncultured Shewanella sp.]|uniref:hypothetical protein n=1 Tax=uncultured Shewanella sp. TaxID=173975 RepID=UPI00262CE3EC|nr:hypothetical protein [uncultured Shewanella sp.]
MPTDSKGNDPDKKSPTSIHPEGEGSQTGYSNTKNFAGVKGWKMSVKTAYKLTPGSVSWLCTGGSWWAAVGLKSNLIVGMKTGINVGGQFGFSVKKLSFSPNFKAINLQQYTAKGKDAAALALRKEALINSWEDFVTKLDAETETATLMSENLSLRSNEINIAESEISSAVVQQKQSVNRVETMSNELVSGVNHINNLSLDVKAANASSEVLTNKVKTTVISMLEAQLTTFA